MSGTITHSWNGTILTVTSDSGTSSADLKGEKGDTGIRGAQGAEGKLDTSFVYTKVSPPTAEEVGAHPNTWLPTPTQIGAAPSGYGLGTQGGETETNDVAVVDTFKRNGWYRYYNANNVELLPGVAGSHACEILVEMFNFSYGRQTAYTLNGYVAERVLWNGVWRDWDVRNPQMIVGVEYRTTERWQGKVVYTQVVNCGFAPNVSYKGIAFPYSVIRCLGFCDAGNGYTMSLPLNYGNSGTIVSCHHQSGNIIVYSNDNSSAYTVYVQVWYLKD